MSNQLNNTNHLELSSAAQDELLKNAKSLSEYLEQLKRTKKQTLSQYLNSLLIGRNDININRIVDTTSLNKSYVYRIFALDSNEKPSRETLLEISAAMELTLEETNRVLKLGKYSALRSKDDRDAIIIFGLLHGKTYDEINTMLGEKGQQRLGDKKDKKQTTSTK